MVMRAMTAVTTNPRLRNARCCNRVYIYLRGRLRFFFAGRMHSERALNCPVTALSRRRFRLTAALAFIRLEFVLSSDHAPTRERADGGPGRQFDDRKMARHACQCSYIRLNAADWLTLNGRSAFIARAKKTANRGSGMTITKRDESSSDVAGVSR